MATLTLPQARIPLGWAVVAGKRVPVEIDIEWMRAFLTLVNRTGGVVAEDIDVAALRAAINAKPVIFDDEGDEGGASWMPGPQGPQGPQGAPAHTIMGEQGEQGEPGFVCVTQGSPPSVSVGLTATAGAAQTYMRSDAAPALSQSISPTWTGVHTFQPSSGVKLHDAQITSAGAAVYARLANGSNAASSAAVLSLDASANGFGVRDCQVRATNDGGNALTLSFWTANGAAPTSKLEIGPTGQVAVQIAGRGLSVKEGANAKQGTATLVTGTVTVNNTSVTANSRIFLTVQSLGTVAAPKAVAVTARTAGTSFVITSADATDTSVVAYEIFEPS